MQNDFWQFNLGNVLTIITVAFGAMGIHSAWQKENEKRAAEWQDMKTKLDLIFQWFERNVVGRGEPVRKADGDD